MLHNNLINILTVTADDTMEQDSNTSKEIIRLKSPLSHEGMATEASEQLLFLISSWWISITLAFTFPIKD